MKAKLIIEKAIPKYTIPEGLKGINEDILNTIKLEGYPGFSWNDLREMILINKNEYDAIYTPEDTQNYHIVQVKIPIEVIELNDIYIKETLDKITYFKNSVLNLEGLIVMGKYSDGIDRQITTKYNVSPMLLQETGIQEITVEYRKKITKFKVKVIDKKISGITVIQKPNKTIYIEGEKLNTDGLVVVERYDDGSEKPLDGKYELSQTDLNIVGKQEIIVTYNGMQTSFYVIVEKKQVQDIELVQGPNKTEYFEGEYFDKTGMKVVVKYNNGTSNETTNYTITPNEALTLKDTEITITYSKDGITKTIEQQIKVKENVLESIIVSQKPNKTEYIIGESLDLDGLQVVAKYSDGTEVDITDKFINQTAILNEAGEKTIILEHKGMKTSFIIIVKEEEKEELKVVINENTEIIEEDKRYISNINSGTTIEKLIENIETTPNAEIKVYKAEELVTNKEEKIVTGMRVEISLGSEKIEYTTIVKGDATGDGQVNIEDMIKINNYRLFGTSKNFEKVYQMAVDVNEDGEKDLKDIIKINNYRLFGTKF